jgi:hypothetical protein
MVRKLERLCPYCGETTPVPRRAVAAVECACRQSAFNLTAPPSRVVEKSSTSTQAHLQRHISNVDMNPQLDARERMIVALYMRRFASWSRVPAP